LTNGESQIMLALKSGKAIRFEENKTRPMGRNASGVRGIRLADEKNDEVVGMITINEPDKETVLVVSEKGYGKRSFINNPNDPEDIIYNITNRGGKGVKTMKITDKTGHLVALKSVTDKDDLMIIKKSGVAIRLSVSEIKTKGRATQGVRLINLRDNDAIAAVAKVAVEDELDDVQDDQKDG